jgi:pilus assembly protein CpaF
LDDEHPILEGRMPDGSRVQAVLGTLTARGAHVAIRKFQRHQLDLAAWIRCGAVSEDVAALLTVLVRGKHNVVVSGGTGTGKTSLLNALTAMVPTHERIVVLEDARELSPQGDHVVQLEARPPDARGRFAVSIRALFKATLRMRPDRIVVGEIRDGAALDLIQAMTSGHGGCLSTLHASHPRDAIHRLETMALMSDVALPLPALRTQLASAIDIIVQLDRLRCGARVVTHVSEVRSSVHQAEIDLVDLYRREGVTPESLGALRPTGHLPSREAALSARGLRLPAAMVDRARDAKEHTV